MSHSVVQSGFKLLSLPQLPECWGYRYPPPCLDFPNIFKSAIGQIHGCGGLHTPQLLQLSMRSFCPQRRKSLMKPSCRGTVWKYTLLGSVPLMFPSSPLSSQGDCEPFCHLLILPLTLLSYQHSTDSSPPPSWLHPRTIQPCIPFPNPHTVKPKPGSEGYREDLLPDRRTSARVYKDVFKVTCPQSEA